MNVEKMRDILNKVKEYDNIIIFRHKRPDGDAVGSTKGLREILRLTYPQKKIYLLNSDSSDYLSFLGDEDEPISDELYCESLGIIIDTATTERISNPKYSLCKEIVKIVGLYNNLVLAILQPGSHAIAFYGDRNAFSLR